MFCWAGSFNVPCSAGKHITKHTSSKKMNYVLQNFDGCKFFANVFEPWQHNRRHPWLVNPDEVVLFLADFRFDRCIKDGNYCAEHWENISQDGG